MKKAAANTLKRIGLLTLQAGSNNIRSNIVWVEAKVTKSRADLGTYYYVLEADGTRKITRFLPVEVANKLTTKEGVVEYNRGALQHRLEVLQRQRKELLDEIERVEAFIAVAESDYTDDDSGTNGLNIDYG